MADTMVERLTGQTAAADVNVEVHLIMPVASLVTPDDTPQPRLRVTGPSPPGSPATCCTPAGVGCGGGGCSPPPPAARTWGGIRSGAASTAGRPSPSARGAKP